MAWGFRKSKKIGPVRFSLSKGSASVSIGGKFGRVTANTKGDVHASASAPGTGLHVRQKLNKKQATKSSNQAAAEIFIDDQAPASAPIFRTWTDATGSFRVAAYLVGIDPVGVTLQGENGEQINVPHERLCKADRDFLATL